MDSHSPTTSVRVRYADTDQMGIAYYGIYLTWFEIGRTEVLRNVGLTYHEIEKLGFRLPVIEAGVQYLKPARYDDVLTIETHFRKTRGWRLRFEYILWCNAEQIAAGFTEHVFTDKDLRPIKPSQDLRDYLKGFLEPEQQ